MFENRIDRLERRINEVAFVRDHKDRDIVVSYGTIEALNAWALFSRSFYLSCALGSITERKKIVTMTSITDPLGYAIVLFKPKATPISPATLTSPPAWHRRDEPPWHDPTVLMRICGNLKCSIQNEIINAFSLNLNVFRDLPIVRNFFAHRNSQTIQAVRNIAPRYTLPTHLIPTEFLISVSMNSTVPVILDWLAEMKITAEFLCKA